jgi:hypothetical protein
MSASVHHGFHVGASDERSVVTLIDEFFAARRPYK